MRRWLLCTLLVVSGCTVQDARRPFSARDELPPPADTYRGESLLYHFMRGESPPTPAFALANPGDNQPVDYARFGVFRSLGTPDYTFTIRNMEGLGAAVGEGIYPNQDAVIDNPIYRELQQAGIFNC